MGYVYNVWSLVSSGTVSTRENGKIVDLNYAPILMKGELEKFCTLLNKFLLHQKI